MSLSHQPLSLNRLNERQREAVLHTEGPLLILAGAGSGKTSTMTYRIAHLISDKRVPATNILGLSFTNKAAGELRERVAELVRKTSGKKAIEGLAVSTFHSLCVRLLRVYGSVLGFQPNFTIIDENDRRDLLRQIFKNVRIDDRKFDLDVVLFEIGQAKSKLLSPEQASEHFLSSPRLGADYQVATATAFGHYQRQLKTLNSMDFDDLLYYGVELLERHADVRERVNERFRYILVDEYQDTNATQFRLLELMTARSQNLCVVGDDDQSIYSWRGADPSHILGFHKRFPKAKVITLDQNYRSTGNILEAANRVIVNNRSRHPKSLWSDRGQGSPLSEVIVEDDHGEGQFVADEIERRHREHQTPYQDFA
ncbi:MAG TPA: UvrD-helicase domain-containing protein, partial [Bdellovibrionota bacterium]|nr:UvrD-helicase domain-containing protein [Bdellovibrionota bacterium]